MKLLDYFYKCIVYLIPYNSFKYTVFCFRLTNSCNTQNFKLKHGILKSHDTDTVYESSPPLTNVVLSPEEDLLKQTKDWILSKTNDDIISSAHLEGNFKDLFQSRRSSSQGVLLDVKNASIWLRDRILFEEVSFSVKTGECVGIIGNNGVGKSSMFDSIYERICGLNSSKDCMSVTMDLSFNVRDDDLISDNLSNSSNMYTFVSKLMNEGNVEPQELLSLYESHNSEDLPLKSSCINNLSGVGYMRQNYTLDLDHESLVSDLISKVFESYNVRNSVINYIESNIEYFDSLLSDPKYSKISNEILSLYNREGTLIRERFSDMKSLIRRLVSLFGMESVINSRVDSLSGGFKMRLYLFLLLLHSPNLLLLDEPTNNLDITTVKFLIDVLNVLMKTSKLSVLVVSHDVNLLNSICTSILQMTGDGKIYPYKGNFEDFVVRGANEKIEKNSRIEKLTKIVNNLTKEIKELKISKKGSQKALKVTISQKEELLDKYQEELDGLIGPPISKYTKTYNRVLFNNADNFNAIFGKILNKNELLNVGQSIKSFSPIFRLMNVTLDTNEGKRIFENLDLTVYPSERMVLLGDNGIGKTTLLKLLFKSQYTFKNNPLLNQISTNDKKLMNESINNYSLNKDSNLWKLFEQVNQVNREMTNVQKSVYDTDDIEYRILMNEPFNFKLVDGLMSMSDGKISYYSQNCSNILNYNKTVYNLLRDYVSDEIGMDLLGQYMEMFHLREYMDSSVSNLSFGERSRLLLSLLLLNKSHFMLLDEPTNHLDLFMKKLLKLIINDIYKGGFIVATHDLDFIKDLKNIKSYVYIHSKDKVFKFNENFGTEYIKFKSENPESNRQECLKFLNQCSEDNTYSKLKKITFDEEEFKSIKNFKQKKKVHPGPKPNSKLSFKNLKRWK